MSGYTFTSSKPWHKCTRAQLLEGVEVAIEQRDKQIARAEAAESRVADLEAEVETWKARVGRANNARDYAEREFHRVATDLRVLRGRLRALVGDEATS